MAMAGCKMTLGYSKKKILVLGSDFSCVNGRHFKLRSKSFQYKRFFLILSQKLIYVKKKFSSFYMLFLDLRVDV